MKTPTTLLALALTVALSHALAAQTIGVKAGGSFSTFDRKLAASLDPNDLRRTDELSRFSSIGGSVFLELTRGMFTLQPELMILAKGAKFGDPTATEDDVKLKLNYLEVPVSLLVRLPKGPYIFGGPSIAYEMSCLSQVKQGIVKISSRCNEQNAPVPDRRKLDYGVHVGAGFRYQIGRRILMLEARELWGLRDIDNDPASEFRNRSFAVMLGYTSAPGARRGR